MRKIDGLSLYKFCFPTVELEFESSRRTRASRERLIEEHRSHKLREIISIVRLKLRDKSQPALSSPTSSSSSFSSSASLNFCLRSTQGEKLPRDRAFDFDSRETSVCACIFQRYDLTHSGSSLHPYYLHVLVCVFDKRRKKTTCETRRVSHFHYREERRHKLR